MKLKLLFFITVFFLCTNMSNAKTYTVSGYVVDKETGETIIGVNVIVKGLYIGSATDGNGYFRITGLKPGKYFLDISHIAYELNTIPITIINKGMILDEISIQPKAFEIDDIVVVGERSEVADVEIEAGHRVMTPKAIKSIPATRGDVFRAIKYLPGIEGVDPISPLYSVRGSDPGENLILLDGVTIYNPYHFVTASGLFNLYAIKNVEMLVGGFGAEYGGRNSSVLYITTREGNSKKLHGEIEPTLTYTNAVFDFPISKNVTMMVSGRFFYDLVSRFFFYSPSYFYDTNISLTWKINRQNRLSLRYFHSQDLMEFESKTYFSYIKNTFDTDIFDDYDFEMKNDWRNQAVTAILKTVITPKIYLRTQLSGSFFSSNNRTLLDFEYYDEDDDQNAKLYYRAEIKNKIRDISAKSMLSIKLNSSNVLSLGGEYNEYYFANNILINYLSEGETTRKPRLLAGFIEDKINLWALTVRGGMRYSKFNFMNKWYAEPRVNAILNLPFDLRLKGAWGKYYQYIMSINSQDYELSQFLENYYPLQNREPSASTHYIFGLEKNIFGNSRLSLDFFYKDISRVYTFDYNVSQLEALKFSEKLKPGAGESYGAELLWQGAWHKFSGWMSYGICRSTRSYPHIMNGKSYIFDYDRTHSFKAMINHQIHPAISYSGTLRIMSGVPKTIESTVKTYYYYEPKSGEFGVYPTNYNETKNNARLPLFIRLDLGLKKRVRKGFGAQLAKFLGAKESYINVSFQNLLFYFHRNVWFYVPIDNDDKMYGFGTNYFPIFSTGYTIKF